MVRNDPIHRNHDSSVPTSMRAGTARDLAGREYWDNIWSSRGPQRVNLLNFYHSLYARLFADLIRPGMRVLEIGCGGSIWLPYLAARGAEAWGIDYSPVGIARAEANLRAAGAVGRLIQGDVLATTELPTATFDLVYSFGLIEHFDTPATVVAHLATYLRSQGRMLTAVPNLDGLVGWFHRVVDADVYRAHRRLDPTALDDVHRRAGLELVWPAAYFGVFSVAVVNFMRWRRRLPPMLDRPLWFGLRAIQQAPLLLLRALRWYPESKWLSPWVQGLYEKRILP